MTPDPVAQALAYLRGHQVMSLATNGPGGVWAAAVFYASEQFALFFLSARDTRHVQNLLQNPRAAATIQEDYDDWRKIKGIQLEGTVYRLAGEERSQVIARYRAKYPFLDDAPPHIRQALEAVDWFRLAPDHLYFIDNSRGFGHRDRIL